MKTSRQFLFAGLSGLMFAWALFSRAAEVASAPAGDKLYVNIEYYDPIRFDHMRYARSTGDELILATLKDSAAAQARFAGYAGEIAVLDEHAKAPAGAPVLTLTWNDGAVAADFAHHGQSKFLGIVNREPLSYHPDFRNMQRSIDSAGLADARRDAAVRAGVQMDLYLALHYLVHYQKSAPAA
jgi:hypothetical protein